MQSLKVIVLFVFHIFFYNVALGDDENENGKSSLVFVFDVTGSMYNDLEQLRESAEMIMDTALKSENNVISNFIFVPFHDPAVGPATVTRDKKVFKSALNSVRVRGGGDCPEKSLTGIQLALNVSLPRSYIYVLTDATANDHNLVNNVLDQIQRKQSQVVFILTGHCNDTHKPSFKVYQQISGASSGQIFNLNKTSVHKVLDFVRSSVTGRMVNLGTTVNPAGTNFTQAIPVDSTLGEVTVSVSGSKPQIKVVDPTGEEIDGPPKLITTLDLSEIMVVKVLQPEPGNWTITVGSEDDYSVRVVGMSNLTFQHGFSLHRPKSMVETSYRPLQGAHNYLMIKLSEVDQPVTLKFIEILTLEGKVLFELPLREIDTKNRIYLTEAFIPPESFFYIAINGHDENNQELRRIGAAAVEAKLPSIPYLTARKQVTARIHDRVTLRCIVESLVPVSAQWTRGTAKLQSPLHSVQSTVTEYVIENLTEEKTGTYRCIAQNVAGLSKVYTTVSLTVDPPSVSMEPNNVTLFSGEKMNIQCSVHSDAQLKSFYFKFEKNNTNKVLDATLQSVYDGYYYFNKTFDTNETNSGIYSCHAANKAGESHKEIFVNVLSKPNAHVYEKIVSVKVHNNLKLVCRTENIETVEWVAPNNTVVSNSQPRSKIYDAILNIYSVSEIDEGDWKCVGTKWYLKVSSTVNVIVTIKPIVSVEGSKSLISYYGTQLTLKCKIKAKPLPIVVWTHNEDVIKGELVPFELNHYMSSLLISNVTESVEGEHKCVVKNTDGASEDLYFVKVVRNMTVLQRPRNMAVELYKSTQLRCQIDSYPKSQMKWYHNSTLLVLSKNVQLLDNNTIVITRTDFENSGTYTCEAKNDYEKLVLNATLDICGLEPPALAQDLAKVTAQAGKTAKIQCRILHGKPSPEVNWKRKINNTYYTNLTQDVIFDNINELSIPKVETYHSGTYTCIAKNAVGEDLHDVSLLVQYAPIMVPASSEPIEKIEVAKGSRVDLNCEVKGEPEPLLIWSKGNATINYSKNIYLTDNNLVIGNVTENDSGMFYCIAFNVLGSVQKNFSLFIYELPVISEPSVDLEIEVLEGELVELPCSVLGVPFPSVEWRQNQDIVKGDRKFIDEQFTLRFIANLTDFGEYECIARNNFGTVSRTYKVYVWVPPYMEPPLQVKKEIITGSNISLHCDAVGFPLPTIFWEFNDDILYQNSSDLSFNDFGDIYISNVSRKLEGVFSCVAENIAGYLKRVFQVTIYELPRIISENYTGPYIATDFDTALSIPCKSLGRPTPVVKWMKDDVYLHKDPHYSTEIDGTLLIKSPVQELSGNYTCVAENSVGAVEKIIPVEIYALPKAIQSDQAVQTVTLVEGTTGEIHCPIRASASDTIKWYKDANLLEEGQLIFQKVSRFNASSYACAVSNSVGSASAFIDLNVEWPPAFLNESIEKIEVDKENDVYLDCEVDAKPVAKCKWTFNGKQLIGESNCYLKVMNVKDLHSGFYTCLATNEHGAISRRFELFVLARPYISDFDYLEVQLKDGTDHASLSCSATGTPKPDIHWVFDNDNWKVDNSSLSSTKVTVYSSGIFKCVARNKAGVASIVYQVTVLVPATVRDIVFYNGSAGIDVIDKVEVLIGDYARIACEGSGSPAPHVQWFRNGKIVSESGSDTYYADLLFQNISTSHTGSYYCIVSNDAGKEEKKVTLDVLEPPKIFTSLFYESNEKEQIQMEIMSGQSFYLHCHPYGNPAPELYWFKGGVPLRFYDDKMVSTEFGEILASKSASEELSGNYTCVARNKIGESIISYFVDILVPPQNVKNNSTTIISRVGKTVEMSCPSEGTPAPNTFWIKLPYTEITSESFPSIDLTDDNVTLIIRNTETSDNGKYLCVITNKVGMAEVTFELIVETPPSILSNSKDTESHVVSLGRSVVLKCLTDGYPRPKIRWLKNTIEVGQSLSNLQRALSNSLLTIWRTGVRDAGQYICVAENSAGSMYRRFDVRVRVPGKWSRWSQWSLCNVSCGLGYQRRARYCQYIGDNFTIDAKTNNSYMILDESECKGTVTDRRKCHMPACEEDRGNNITGHWSAWSPWSACSASCGVGTVMRTRRCRPATSKCRGDNLQIRQCSKSIECGDVSDDNSTQSMTNGFTDTSQNSYLPAATFEIQPEIVNTNNNFDIDVIDTDTGRVQANTESSASRHFDIIVSENIDHSPVDVCDAGYRHNETTQECQDIDECLYTNNQCHSTQSCHNTLGGYSCVCPLGYMALGPSQRCLDINECEQDLHRCEYACVNVAGGYVCACPKHLRLHPDKHHCVSASSPVNNIEELNDDEILNASVDAPNKYK